MNWLRTVGVAIGGFLLLMAFQILGRDGRRAKKAENQADALLKEGSDKSKAKAEKKNAKATFLKDRAKASAKKTKETLNAIDQADNDSGKLLSAYKSERLRQRRSRNT